MHLCLSAKILHNHCFQVLLGITVVPREIKDNGSAKFWGINKVLYSLCENGKQPKSVVRDILVSIPITTWLFKPQVL